MVQQRRLSQYIATSLHITHSLNVPYIVHTLEIAILLLAANERNNDGKTGERSRDEQNRRDKVNNTNRMEYMCMDGRNWNLVNGTCLITHNRRAYWECIQTDWTSSILLLNIHTEYTASSQPNKYQRMHLNRSHALFPTFHSIAMRLIEYSIEREKNFEENKNCGKKLFYGSQFVWATNQRTEPHKRTTILNHTD